MMHYDRLVHNRSMSDRTQKAPVLTSNSRGVVSRPPRCRTDVYGLVLRNGHALGSIVVGTRWECCMRYV
jgi:hypothetical protein